MLACSVMSTHVQNTMRQIAHVIGVWICATFFFCSPAAGQNVKITDYDVPVSQSQRLNLTAEMSLEESNEFGEYYRRDRYVFAGRLESFYNSLPYAWKIDFGASWRGNRWFDERLTFQESASFAGSIHKYIREEGLLFGGGSIKSTWWHRYRRPNIDISLSAGLGRYVEATALAKALRIEEFLLAEHVLAKHLPKEGLLELASIINREGEYLHRYGDTYTVWWYDDMEKVIVLGEGLPNGTIGALGIMRMRDVLEREEVRPRAHGWNIEVGIGLPIADGHVPDPGDPQPFFAASFARPLGLKHQISGEVRAATEATGDFGDYFEVEASLIYSFELSNRIDLIFTDDYSNVRRIHEGWFGPLLTKQRQNRARLLILYYVENRVTINLSGLLHHQDNHVFTDRRRSWLIDFSVGYHVF